MDALQLLESEHDELEARLRKLEQAHDRTRARHLFQEVKDQVDLLERLEDTYLYPPLRETDDARDLALESKAEHDLVNRLIEELSNLKTDHPEWQPKARVLAETLERHIKEEETQLFPRIRMLWDPDKLRHYYRKMEQLKAQWKKEKALGLLELSGS
jgi:hemerythrin-like domain-containing protein